ncbi:RmlC-like cupin domain-containing protein [Mycena rebaudengoi]|nr:RmlC-like cupin domain-containing protein [Mycena rebaudengoi]
MFHLQQTSQELIAQLNLQKHPEGGYYAETDRQKSLVPTPFVEGDPPRSLATSIYYLLTHDSPNGFFHMNKSVTYHIHHQGRAEYTLITPGHEGPGKGETRMLLVGTGVWKMSRLLDADVATEGEKRRLFHWEDHNFLTLEGLRSLMSKNGEVREFEKYVK